MAIKRKTERLTTWRSVCYVQAPHGSAWTNLLQSPQFTTNGIYVGRPNPHPPNRSPRIDEERHWVVNHSNLLHRFMPGVNEYLEGIAAFGRYASCLGRSLTVVDSHHVCPRPKVGISLLESFQLCSAVGSVAGPVYDDTGSSPKLCKLPGGSVQICKGQIWERLSHQRVLVYLGLSQRVWPGRNRISL